ncbi:MAG: ATP-binding protein [Microcoleaceae cyanobacterium]
MFKWSLKQQIIVPFLSVSISLWTLGIVGVGYWLSYHLQQQTDKELETLSSLVLREFETQTHLLRTNARLLADSYDIRSATQQYDKTALIKTLLPIKSTLGLDLVKVIDQNRTTLVDLRGQALVDTQLRDEKAISQVLNGVYLSTLLVAKQQSQSIIIGTSPLKPREGVIGGIFIGTAVSDELLQQIKQQTLLELAAFSQGQLIASTSSQLSQSSWQAPAVDSCHHTLKIQGQTYLAKTVSLSGLDDTTLELVLLKSLAPLHKAQSQLWVIVILFGVIGAGIICLVGTVLAQKMTSRIKRLTQATKKLANGDLQTHLPIEGSDEITILAEGFNVMVQQVAERDQQISIQMQTLEETLHKLQQTPHLVQTEKMSALGRMVAGVAHEINNPVSFIYGNLIPAEEYINDVLNLLQLYQQEYPQPTPTIETEIEEIDLEFLAEDLPKLLQSIKIGAERIREIVKSLRNFSRLDEAEIKAVDIHSGLESTLTILSHRLKVQPYRPEIEVIHEYTKLPLVECYSGQLNQVFMNLLANAIDAIEEYWETLKTQNPEKAAAYQPCIQIQTEILDSNFICIQLTDNGPGIPEEIRSKLFDPFFTTKPVGKGTGLGLSISYQIIVEKHHGELLCDSTPAGGTQFIIQLPICLEKSESAYLQKQCA